MVDRKKTAERILQYINRAGMTRYRLAQIMFVSYKAVYSWCKGKKIPSIDNVARMAEIFGCTMDELVVRKEKNDTGK